MSIVELTDDKQAICRRILDALPLWFGIEEAKQGYIRDIGDLPMFGCLSGAQIVGFLALKLHNAFSAEILVMGVLPAYFRQGLGTRLVNHAEQYALGHGIRFLTVKTLSPTREDANYEGTRKFYLSVGLVPLMELPSLWGPNNPCLLMAKNVS